MKLTEAFLAELQIEAAATRKMLERIPQESLAWKPHDKSRTLGAIAAHIAHIPSLFLAPLLEEEFDRNTFATATGTVAEILAAFDSGISRGREALSALTDDRLLAPWRYKYGDRVIFDMPRFVVIRTTALNHLIHHRGQLSVYLRCLNIPLPPVYGPTADES